ncbi:hypothetical protein HID58_059610, partial [Brassica napus]
SPARFDEDYNLKWFSESITIVDQSVHELCSLVSDSVLELSRGLLELQSALEGFLILIGYEQKHGDWKFNSTENHPFVRVCDTHSRSSCRHEALPDNRNFSCIVKTLVDAFIVVARDLVGTRLYVEVIEMHVFGVQLVDTVLLLFHQKASCVMLNKGKHIVEVVSMLVTILQFRPIHSAGYALEHVALEYLVVIVFICFFMKEFFGA